MDKGRSVGESGSSQVLAISPSELGDSVKRNRDGGSLNTAAVRGFLLVAASGAREYHGVYNDH